MVPALVLDVVIDYLKETQVKLQGYHTGERPFELVKCVGNASEDLSPKCSQITCGLRCGVTAL